MTNNMNFTLLCDTMTNLEGSIQPPLYLADSLVERGYAVSMVSPVISSEVEDYLLMKGIHPVNLHTPLFAKKWGSSSLWLEVWMRKAFLRLNSNLPNKRGITLNFSQTFAEPSLIWYLQGPPSIALKEIEKEVSFGFRIAYKFLKPFIQYADKKLVSHIDKFSEFAIANSNFCASMYSKFGVKTYDIIYPPIDRQLFRPLTSHPSADYVLTYFGKESKFSTLKKIADMGVKLQAFGSKMPFIRKDLIEHPNIEFLGRVSPNELVNLYSNALFTLFLFTHEPFGYVPVESMACGTPVLTYDIQGPSEYVIPECSGWLAHTDAEVSQKALDLWKNGYPSCIRQNCVEIASEFDKKIYVQKWLKLLEGLKGYSFL